MHKYIQQELCFLELNTNNSIRGDDMEREIQNNKYLATMLISDMPKHYKACSDAIEQLLFMLENSVSHHCFYDENFTPEYKIEAILKMNTILETIYTDGNYGKNWLPLIYNYGNLGRLYFRTGTMQFKDLCI